VQSAGRRAAVVERVGGSHRTCRATGATRSGTTSRSGCTLRFALTHAGVACACLLTDLRRRRRSGRFWGRGRASRASETSARATVRKSTDSSALHHASRTRVRASP
jgi:hypothetical protein